MLVSVNEVRAYLNGLPLEAWQVPVLEDVIKRAQKVVETAINRPVERVQVREVVRSDSKGYLYLSVTPVVKIISCGGTTAYTPVESTPAYPIVRDPSLDEDARIIDKVPSTPLLSTIYPGRYYSGSPNSTFVIEYIGGLNPDEIDDIKRVIVQLVAREWGPSQINEAGLEGGMPDNVDRQDNRGLSLSDDERKALQRYRRRIVM